MFASLTVAENLAVGAYRDRRDKRAVRERLERVHARFPRLAERAGQRAGTLSGGEQQLLVIARALMGAPDLLILEEPSAGLAPPAIAAVAEALAGLTVLIADEQLALARHARPDRARRGRRGRARRAARPGARGRAPGRRLHHGFVVESVNVSVLRVAAGAQRVASRRCAA